MGTAAHRLSRCSCAAFLATMSLTACTGTPAPTPTPTSTPPAPSPATSSSPTSSVAPTEMAPSEIPSRNATSGGTLTLTLGDATATLHDIVCDSTSGLSVIASAGNLTGAQFTVDGAGAVTDVAITLPENVTALVGKQVGSAQFSGSPQRFAVRGEAITAVQGTSRAVPFRIDGSC